MGADQYIASMCVFVFTAIALVCDWKTSKLPNLLTVPTFCAGLLFHAVNGFLHSGLSGTGHELLFALGGFGVGFGLLLLLWFIGGGGGGDVKFMGALGCWLGAWLTLQVLVVSAVLAGLMTAILVAPKVFQMKRLRGGQHAEKKKAESPANWSVRSGSGWRVPFGVPLAFGTWFVLIVELSGYGLPWPPIH